MVDGLHRPAESAPRGHSRRAGGRKSTSAREPVPKFGTTAVAFGTENMGGSLGKEVSAPKGGSSSAPQAEVLSRADYARMAAAEGSGDDKTMQFVVMELFGAGVTLGVIWVAFRWMRETLMDTTGEKRKAKELQDSMAEKLEAQGVTKQALENMSMYEVSVMSEMVFASDIDVTFNDIGGLQSVKEAMREIVVYPFSRPDIFQGSQLLSPPKGVLLYGPPGTGKTMIAKAVARESKANFIALSPSSLMSKWVGDTEQLVRAVFSFAQRVQPCIIFLDEVEALFQDRGMSTNEVHRDMKAEFLQLWDGLLTSDAHSSVIIMGATNRPWDIDSAIQRRMPRSFLVGLPDQSQRAQIIRKVVQGTRIDPGFDTNKIAAVTDGYSGSDLKELCRAAALQPVREAMRGPQSLSVTLRPLQTEDVLDARDSVRRTAEQSEAYRNAVNAGANNSDVVTGSIPKMEDLMTSMMMLSQMNANPQAGIA